MVWQPLKCNSSDKNQKQNWAAWKHQCHSAHVSYPRRLQLMWEIRQISVSVFSFKSERNVPIIFSSHLPYSQKIQQTPVISESVQETWTMSTEKNFKSYAVTDFLPFSYQLPPTIFQAQVIINKITKIISMWHFSGYTSVIFYIKFK